MYWWRVGEHYFSSSVTQEIPLTTPSWFTLILDTHTCVLKPLFPVPPNFQLFCSTFRWWKLKTCGYNFYEKFHFESFLNFNFTAMRETEETKDLSHPLTQKPLVKTFNKCKISAASCWKSWPLDWGIIHLLLQMFYKTAAFIFLMVSSYVYFHLWVLTWLSLDYSFFWIYSSLNLTWVYSSKRIHNGQGNKSTIWFFFQQLQRNKHPDEKSVPMRALRDTQRFTSMVITNIF